MATEAQKKAQFKPGESGNPGGLPQEVREARKLCREKSIWAVNEIIKLSQTSKSEKIRFDCLRELLDRGLGKPRPVLMDEKEESQAKSIYLGFLENFLDSKGVN